MFHGPKAGEQNASGPERKPQGGELDPTEPGGVSSGVFSRGAIEKLAGEPNLLALWRRRGKLWLGDKLERSPRRMHCHPFVIKKRDGGGWDLGKMISFCYQDCRNFMFLCRRKKISFRLWESAFEATW